MGKVSFYSSLGQKDPEKEQENSEVLIRESGELHSGVCGQRQSRLRYLWLGLAIMLTVLAVGGFCVYWYLEVLLEGQEEREKAPGYSEEREFYCGVSYLEEHYMAMTKEAELSFHLRYLQETVEVLQDYEAELIRTLEPKVGDPAHILHDFSKNLTAYLDLKLDMCYIIPLNTSTVMPPKDFQQLLANMKDGKYLPQSYLIREWMMVIEPLGNVDLGHHINNFCHGKEIYKLQREDTTLGMQKREARQCRTFIHFENTFAVETKICSPGDILASGSSQKPLIVLLLLSMLFLLGCI